MPRTRKILNITLIVFTVVVAAGMTLCAYIGYLSPAGNRLAGLLPLTFPIWIAVTLLAGIADLFFCRRGAWIALAGFVASTPAVLNYSPLHPFAGTPKDEPTLTLLTYNALQFISQLPGNPYPGGVNPTLSYIINSDADIAAIQESPKIEENKSLNITRSQIDSLKAAYPYIEYCSISQTTLLSRYPIRTKPVTLPATLEPHVMCADISVGDDTIRLYSVHLQSFQLNDDDKRLYHDLATLESSRSEMRKAKTVLLSKLTTANAARAVQADTLLAAIDAAPTQNIIVCGDFNDVSSSYTVRTICRANNGLKQAYSDAGFGPMVTYNRRSFPFRIDHVLYCGQLKAVDIDHGDIRSSDHYPVKTVFTSEILKPDKRN